MDTLDRIYGGTSVVVVLLAIYQPDYYPDVFIGPFSMRGCRGAAARDLRQIPQDA